MLSSRSAKAGRAFEMRVPFASSERFALDNEAFFYRDRRMRWRTAADRLRLWTKTWSRADIAIAAMSLLIIVYMSLRFYVPSSLYMYVTLVCFTAPSLLATSVLRWRVTGRASARLVTTGCITALVLASLAADIFAPKAPRHWRTPAASPYYIASLLHNSEAILPHYSRSLLQLARDLGPSNVYVSIYENDSKDRTPAMLGVLESKLQRLGVRTHIVRSTQPPSMQQKNRIERLSHYRNLALAPFNDILQGMLDGRPFDKVIWLNDILFEADTVHALLDTAGGEFDQACAMDFCWLGFYDTWVMRDADGKTVRPFWPYFRATSDQERARARLPVPVNSCWNGMTAFDARWFTNATAAAQPKKPAPHVTAALTLPQPPLVHTDALGEPATLPLLFRKSDVCFASESLLSSLDMHRIAAPYRPRIYANTDLVVAYDKPNYFVYGSMMRWSVTAPWRYFWQYWIEHRLFGFALHILRRVDPCTDVFMPFWVPRIPAAGRGTS